MKSQERIKEALKESEERYRAVMEQSVEAIYLYDVQTKRVLESNEAFRRMIGYAEEELIGKHIYDFIDHDREDIDANIRRSLQERRRHIGERRYRRKDGTVILVDTSASVISYDGESAVCAVSRDVTKRKEFEEALKESESRFRSLIQNASDVITILDAEGVILYESPAIERILGYEPEERVGKSAFDYMHPEDIERVSLSFVEALEVPGAVQPPIELRLRHKNGSWCHVEVTRSNLLADPTVGGVVANARDVTERKRAEEALRESEARFKQLFERSTDALFVHDEEGRIVDCNAEACRSLGYTREELLALSVKDFATDLLSEEEKRAQRGYTLWERAVRDEPGRIVGFEENELRRKDGSRFPVEVGVGAIDYSGRRLIVASARDITERKRAEEALRESEARFRAVFGRAAIGMALVDMEGSVIESNPALRQMLGYGEEELSGMHFAEVTHPDDVAGDVELFRKLVRGEIDHFRLEKRYIRKDGSLIWGRLTSSSIRSDEDKPRFMVGMVEDITERKRAEETLTEERNLLRTLIDNMPDFIFVKDIESRFVINNTEHARALGAPEEELVGRTDFDVFPEELAQQYYADEQEIIRSGRPLVDREEPVVDHDGNHRWLSTTKVPLQDSTGKISGLVGISRDITDRKALEEQFRHQAFHDPLTQLPNRALFLDRLGHAMARSGRLREPVAVLFVDLDDFKRINDSLGHETGDSSSRNIPASYAP